MKQYRYYRTNTQGIHFPSNWRKRSGLFSSGKILITVIIGARNRQSLVHGAMLSTLSLNLGVEYVHCLREFRMSTGCLEITNQYTYVMYLILK